MSSQLASSFLQLDSPIPSWMIDDLSSDISADLLSDLILIAQKSLGFVPKSVYGRAFQLLQTTPDPDSLGSAFRLLIADGLDPATLTSYPAALPVLLSVVDHPFMLSYSTIKDCISTIDELASAQNTEVSLLLQYPTYIYNTSADRLVLRLLSQPEQNDSFVHQSVAYNMFLRASQNTLEIFDRKLADSTWSGGDMFVAMGISVYLSARLGKPLENTVSEFEKFKRSAPPQALNNWTHFTKFLAGSLYDVDPSFCQILGLSHKEAQRRPYYPYPTTLSGVVLTSWDNILQSLAQTTELGARLRIVLDSFHAYGFENMSLAQLLQTIDLYPDIQPSVVVQVKPEWLTAVLQQANAIELEQITSRTMPNWYETTLNDEQKKLFLAALFNSDWDDFSAIITNLSFVNPRLDDFDPTYLTVESYLGLLHLMVSETSVVNYEQQQDIHAKLCQILPTRPDLGSQFVHLLESVSQTPNSKTYTIADVLQLAEKLS